MKNKLIPESWHEKGKKAIDKMDDGLVKLNEKLGLAPISEAIWNQMQLTRESINDDLDKVLELPSNAKEKMEEAMSSTISKMPPEFQKITKGLGLAVIAAPTVLTIGCDGNRGQEIARRAIERTVKGRGIETSSPDLSTLSKMGDWLCDMVATGAFVGLELVVAGVLIYAVSQIKSSKDWGGEELASFAIATFGAVGVGFGTQSLQAGIWVGGVGFAALFNLGKAVIKTIKEEYSP